MTTRGRRYPQPRPSAEVLAERYTEPCEHGGLPGRCPACRAAARERPELVAPRRRRRRKPKPPPAPPVQLPLANLDDLGPVPGTDR